MAGKVANYRSEGGEIFIDLKVTGTKNDELLRVLSGTDEKLVTVYLCGEDCQALLTGELLVHAQEFMKVKLNRVPWLTNLKDVAE